MRTRYKGDNQLQEIDFSVRVTGRPDEVNIEKLETFTKRSLLADDTWRGFKPIRKSPKPEHPCEHRKVVCKTSGQWPVLDHNWLTFPNTRISMSPSGEFRMPVFTIPDFPDVEEDFKQFLTQSGVEMQQQFNAKASLANFAIELKDFRGLIEKFHHIVTYKTGASIRKVVRQEGRERLRSGVGGAYLDWQFNWKQLIRDIPLLGDSYSKAMERLAILIGHSKFHDHRKRQFKLEPVDPSPVVILDATAFSGYSGFMYQLEIVPGPIQVTFHCNALIDNGVHLDTANQWDATADMLGLNNSPKILWNATKLSWLVEFLWDSRTFFDSFEKEAFKGALAVQGGTCSVKMEQSYAVQIRRSETGFPGFSIVPMGDVVCSSYERRLLNLVKPGFFETKSSLTSDQQKILAGLVDTRLGSLSTGALASAALDKAVSYSKSKRQRASKKILVGVRILTGESNQRNYRKVKFRL